MSYHKYFKYVLRDRNSELYLLLSTNDLLTPDPCEAEGWNNEKDAEEFAQSLTGSIFRNYESGEIVDNVQLQVGYLKTKITFTPNYFIPNKE
jgi:hypothetical protein